MLSARDSVINKMNKISTLIELIPGGDAVNEQTNTFIIREYQHYFQWVSYRDIRKRGVKDGCQGFS